MQISLRLCCCLYGVALQTFASNLTMRCDVLTCILFVISMLSIIDNEQIMLRNEIVGRLRHGDVQNVMSRLLSTSVMHAYFTLS